MGLGGFASVGLARARQNAQAAQEMIAEGIDPLEAKRASQAVPTLEAMADTLVADLSSQWRNEKHRAQ